MTSVSRKIAEILRHAPGKAQWIIGEAGIGKTRALRHAEKLTGSPFDFVYQSLIGHRSRDKKFWDEMYTRASRVFTKNLDPMVLMIDDADCADIGTVERHRLDEFMDQTKILRCIEEECLGVVWVGRKRLRGPILEFRVQQHPFE